MSAWEEYQRTMTAPVTMGSAAKQNDVAMLARLLQAGADVNERDHRGYSPLMLAAYTGNHEAFTWLLEAGADPNSTDLVGNSVLMGTVFKGHVTMVERLIAAGADVFARNHAGLDAAAYATMFGRTQVADVLRAHLTVPEDGCPPPHPRPPRHLTTHTWVTAPRSDDTRRSPWPTST